MQWTIPWPVRVGNYTLRARATDSRGNTQASAVPFNNQGYLFSAVVGHPVSVIWRAEPAPCPGTVRALPGTRPGLRCRLPQRSSLAVARQAVFSLDLYIGRVV